VAPSGQAKYGVGVPIEASTPRPVAYLAGSSLYVHTEPTSFTVTIPQTLTASDTVKRVAGYIQTISETLTASDTAGRLINYVREMTELVGLSDYFAGSPAFTIPELVTIFDVLSYQLVSQGEGGGGGGGPAARRSPPARPRLRCLWSLCPPSLWRSAVRLWRGFCWRFLRLSACVEAGGGRLCGGGGGLGLGVCGVGRNRYIKACELKM